MANSFIHKNTVIRVGDTMSFSYIFKDGEKERRQVFRGILLKVRGDSDATRSITVRKISHSGIGVERVIPLSSPFLTDIKLFKKGRFKKATAYFVRGLSDQQLRRKLYRAKSS